MLKKSESVLVVGFNTRPIVYSLNKAGYDVYTVDFFGDLDLYPFIKDGIIITKQLKTNYTLIKDGYGYYLAKFTIDLLRKHPEIDYLIIGSGMDDNFIEREIILNELSKEEYHIKDLNNNLETIKEARDILKIYTFLTKQEIKTPLTYSLDYYQTLNTTFKFPYIIKKKTGAGGINVYKMEDDNAFTYFMKLQQATNFKASDWLIQEYIDGIPVSCTTISNGKKAEIISINRQILGQRFLNSPKEFMYCGNIVPAYLFKEDNELISQISLNLANHLKLIGINGFDFVLKNHYPYLMEINPRIPGSISASEAALDLNLLKMHFDSFDDSKWELILKSLKRSSPIYYATKLIMYAPNDISQEDLSKINKLEDVHDKTDPNNGVAKNEPLCTVLYRDVSFSDSYFGALKIIDKIKEIIKK